MLILAVVLAGLIVVSLFIGQNADGDDELQWLFWELRSLRSLAAAAVGAALAVSGVLLQGLFRNPLADPSIIGTSAGATLGGMIMVLLGQLTAADIVLPPLLLLPPWQHFWRIVEFMVHFAGGTPLSGYDFGAAGGGGTVDAILQHRRWDWRVGPRVSRVISDPAIIRPWWH